MKVSVEFSDGAQAMAFAGATPFPTGFSPPF